MHVLRCVSLLALTAAPLAAQTAAEHIARGDSAQPFLHPDVALRHYQAALALDSLSFEANWKAARAISDVAKQLLGDSLKDRRDSLYSIGRTYAERALRADSTRAEGHYAMALVLGRLAWWQVDGQVDFKARSDTYDVDLRSQQLDNHLSFPYRTGFPARGTALLVSGHVAWCSAGASPPTFPPAR